MEEEEIVLVAAFGDWPIGARWTLARMGRSRSPESCLAPAGTEFCAATTAEVAIGRGVRPGSCSLRWGRYLCLLSPGPLGADHLPLACVLVAGPSPVGWRRVAHSAVSFDQGWGPRTFFLASRGMWGVRGEKGGEDELSGRNWSEVPLARLGAPCGIVLQVPPVHSSAWFSLALVSRWVTELQFYQAIRAVTCVFSLSAGEQTWTDRLGNFRFSRN